MQANPDGVNYKKSSPTYQAKVITQQPGTSQPPATQQGFNCIEAFAHLEKIQIHQIKEFPSFAEKFKTANRYILSNENNEPCFYAFEESSCCQRTCCGRQRGFVMHILDNFRKEEVLKITRNFQCCGACCCSCCTCCQQECTVSSKSTGLLGTIRKKFGFISSNFEVLDANGQVVLEIEGPNCCLQMGCGDKEYSIRAPNTDQVIGTIHKKWEGWYQEAFTKTDTFSINFPKDLDSKLKGALLGATFLIMNYGFR
ncbi:hypothetical protein CAEBREN_06337 [Caenorhabditis brenneri]|uniref:Phospholipid scramblase n=1 Tax=Caenorhabditis brenneri TaxID=135651 RepID=G0M9D5_CAEBE|nr:hypothetical protein CAEBREN_06337 [Caenorhabditis brenneri]